MLGILVITGPIYLLIALGFIGGRVGLFSRPDMRALGKFVVNFAVPALLFKTLSQRPVSDIFDPGYLFAYATASIGILLSAFAIARYAGGRDVSFSALFGMGMTVSNSGFVGYPIVLQWLGPPAAIALAMCMTIENLVMLPLSLALAESGGVHGDTWQRALVKSLGRMLRNPMIVAILLGFAVALSGVPVPDWISRAVGLLAAASTALALFVIGGSLVGLEIEGRLGDVAIIAAGKLLLHPLAVLAILLVIPPIDARLRAAAVAYAAAPMLSIYPILAQKYGHEGFCAAALLVATVASFVTISAILWAMSAVLHWAP
ncbi:MAG: AEC family transporter [Casimicrobiaceae bacterium]